MTTIKINWKKTFKIGLEILFFLAAIAEFSGYSLREILIKKELLEIPTTSNPSINVSTSGDNSPAFVTDDGEVHINYGEHVQKKDSIKTKESDD